MVIQPSLESFWRRGTPYYTWKGTAILTVVSVRKTFPIFKRVALTVEHKSESLQGLLKHRLLSPTLRVSDPAGLGWAQEFVLLTSSQKMKMSLVLPTCFENH